MGWPEFLNAITGNSSGPIAKTIISVAGIGKDGIGADSRASKEHSKRGNLTKDDALSNLMHKSMTNNGKDTPLLVGGTAVAAAAIVGGAIYGGMKLYDMFSEETAPAASANVDSDSSSDDDDDDDDATPGGVLYWRPAASANVDSSSDDDDGGVLYWRPAASANVDSSSDDDDDATPGGVSSWRSNAGNACCGNRVITVSHNLNSSSSDDVTPLVSHPSVHAARFNQVWVADNDNNFRYEHGAQMPQDSGAVAPYVSIDTVD